MGECKICSGDDNISYTCNECGGTYCSTHRLPEAHNCYALRRRTYDESWFKDELSVRDNHHRSENARVHDEDENDSSDENSGPEPMSVEQIRENKTSTSSSSSREAAAKADSEGSCLECGATTGLECRQCGGRYCENHVELDEHNCQLKSQDKESVGSGTDTPPKPRMPGTETPSRTQRIASSSLSLVLLPLTFAYAAGSWMASHWKASVMVVILLSGGFLAATGQLNPIVEDTLREVETAGGGVSDNGGGGGDGSVFASDSLNESEIEGLVHQRINEIRSNRSLSELNHEPALRDIASGHSENMAEKDFYSHTSPSGENFGDRYEEAGYSCRVPISNQRYSTGAENINIVYAFTEAGISGDTYYVDSENGVADIIVEQWMRSTGHRENILKSYWNNEGIGIEVVKMSDGAGKKVYATQNFC